MRISRIVTGFVSIVAVAAMAVVPVFANSQGAGVSVQSYDSDKPLDIGTIVQLEGEGTGKVRVATQKELQNMFGVTVDRKLLPVTLTGGSKKNEVFVAVTGTYKVLVSDQAGPIRVGDYVTLSSINGIAMKAGTKEKTVLGRAAEVFDGKDQVLGTKTLRDTANGVDKKVAIGSILVNIDIKKNPNDESTKTLLPEFLERIGKEIAQKEVSPIRMYLSLAITAVSLIISLAMLYTGVRNAVISIGRNPMSKKSIFRALLEVILTSALVLIIGLFAVYLLLKL